MGGSTLNKNGSQKEKGREKKGDISGRAPRPRQDEHPNATTQKKGRRVRLIDGQEKRVKTTPKGECNSRKTGGLREAGGEGQEGGADSTSRESCLVLNGKSAVERIKTKAPRGTGDKGRVRGLP